MDIISSKWISSGERLQALHPHHELSVFVFPNYVTKSWNFAGLVTARPVLVRVGDFTTGLAAGCVGLTTTAFLGAGGFAGLAVGFAVGRFTTTGAGCCLAGCGDFTGAGDFTGLASGGFSGGGV